MSEPDSSERIAKPAAPVAGVVAPVAAPVMEQPPKIEEPKIEAKSEPVVVAKPIVPVRKSHSRKEKSARIATPAALPAPVKTPVKKADPFAL